MSLTVTGTASTLASGGEGGSVEWLDLTSRLGVSGGYVSGRYNTGLYNMWFGYAVASDDLAVSGSHNTGLGTYAAFKNQGDYNTWLGARAGFENVSGSENVGVGWSSGGAQTDARGNTSIGHRGGLNALGDGNVSVGHDANARGLSSRTDCNIAVGSAAHATGGDSIALGADANASGRGAIAVGVGATASAPNSLVLGPYVESSGKNSLLIMPRPDGKYSSHSLNDELNIYGVLTGARSQADDSYSVRLSSDSVEIAADGVQASARRGVLHLEAASNIAVLTDLSVSGRSQFTAPSVFSDSAVFVRGLRSGALGDTVFDGKAVFNGPIEISSTSVLDVQEARVGGLEVRDLRVTGSASVSDTFIPNPLFETARVLGRSTFYGPAAFKSGIHVCCAPLTADTVEAHTTKTHHLLVDGDFSVSNAVVRMSDAVISRARVETLTADAAYVMSNLSVSGDLTGSGNLYYSSAFFGTVSAGGFSSTGPISCDSIYSSNIVCDTITVTGANTLKVFGTSELNATETNTLHVKNLAEIDDVFVQRDVYVGSHTNTNTLTVREGTVMAKIDAGFVSAGSLTAGGATVCNLDAGAVHGEEGRFGALAAANASFYALAASNAFLEAALALSASICNLTVETLTLANGLNAQDMSFYNVSLTGNTTADTIDTSGNARFRQDVTIDGKLSAGQLEITEGFSVNTGLPFVLDDTVVANGDAVFRGEVVFEGPLDAADASFSGEVRAGSLYADGDVTVEGCVKWKNPLGLDDYHWDACLVNNDNRSADLQFSSINGTLFTLTDEFHPGVLNFTGKHRCAWAGGAAPDEGLIVVSVGGYENLDGGTEPTMDEALPVVCLSSRARDPRAFGVVAGRESAGSRVFRLANMVFSRASCGDPKVILNSVGEGGMWVCDANGPVANGDLLVTSAVAGHAQRQGDDVVRSVTVAKATGDPAAWVPYKDPATGAGCLRAFLGVVYKF